MSPTPRLLRSAAAALGGTQPTYKPRVRLFTGPHCSLCDDLKRVIARSTQPHVLEVTDISEKTHRDWFRRYKWDIPVLHIDGRYFAKHRVEMAELDSALLEAAKGPGAFVEREGEPDARGQNYDEA